MKYKTIIICLAIGLSLTAFAQEKGFPIRVLVGNEATAIPFHKLSTMPVHPTFQLGTEFEYKKSTHHYLYQTLNIGYVYHKYLFQGAYINSELGYDYQLDFGLNLKSLIGLGYLHTFSTEEEYQFENGEYLSRKDTGNSRIMPSISVGLGFRTAPEKRNSPEIILLYRSWIEYPYSPGFINLMSHTDLSIGIKFYIN